MDTGYSVALDMFEGPLDLLLHLVKKPELSILDIPISFVTEKYLEYLDAMTGLDIDVAGEYLVMAATLCHIKSRELLPSPEPLEEEGENGEGTGEDVEVDPRADLIKRLLEYQKYKEAADQLGQRPVVGRNVWSRGTPTEDAVGDGVDPDAIAPLAPFPVHKLIEAFDRVMRQAKVKVTHNVLIDRLSVSQKISELTDRLEKEGRFAFTSMFSFLKDGVERSIDEVKHEAVVTFLALLEMGKLRLLRLSQLEAEGEIYIERAVDDLRERVEANEGGGRPTPQPDEVVTLGGCACHLREPAALSPPIHLNDGFSCGVVEVLVRQPGQQTDLDRPLSCIVGVGHLLHQLGPIGDQAQAHEGFGGQQYLADQLIGLSGDCLGGRLEGFIDA